MNKSIRLSALFAMLLTVVLLINLTMVMVFQEDKYAHNPKNARGYYELRSVPRGQITAGQTVLATSTEVDTDVYQRSYPASPYAYSAITGYLSSQYGASGLESSYNSVLNGTDSSLAPNRWREAITGKAHAGANVETTIVPEVQQVAFNALSNAGYEGAVVALRPSTGEILALASSPGFDANALVSSKTAEQAWGQLNANPQNPLLNTATQEPLPPGSIFKIITTAAALDSGYTPQTLVTGALAITLPGTNTQLTNYAGQPCAGGGQVTFQTAFALSCNTAFVEAAIKVGERKFREYADAFGVGATYDLGLPMASGELGEIPDEAALGQSAIGQRDVTMSALQAAVMAGTVANDGIRMEPHVVKRITSRDLRELDRISAKKLNRAVTSEQARTIRDLMIASERSTAGYGGQDIASKTGTAEHGAPGTPPHTWYVAFGPTAKADVAVAVVVKNGGGMGQGATGGAVASPIGRAVIAAALRNQR